MSTLWLFGDSFTAGYGAEKNSKYSLKYGPGKTFDILLGEYFNLNVNNFGIPGCSNATILSTLLSNLVYIKPGDFVVIGNTSPLRDLVPNKEGTKLIDQKLFDSTPYPDSLAYKNDRLEKILREYCIEFKKEYLYLWNSHFNSNILNIFKYLNTENITCLLWNYSVWSEEETLGMRFENIKEHTDGYIYDLHWSFNGHKEVFEWIKNGIESEKKFIK